MSDHAPPPTAAPPVGPPLAPDPAAPRESWLTVLLVVLTFVGVVAGVVGAWWRVAPRPPTELQRYFPHASGTALSYVARPAGGPELFQSTSVELLEGAAAGSQLSSVQLSRALSLAGGGSPDDDDEAMLARAAAADSQRVVVARVRETSYEAGGALTQTVSLQLILPAQASLLAVDGRTLDPPLPTLDVGLGLGESITTTGSFDGAAPYTATTTLEAREPLDTPAGRLEDCLRTRVALQIATLDGDTRSWHCAGVGLARYESRALGQDATVVYELTGASAPGLLAPARVPPPRSADVAAHTRGPEERGVIAGLPAGELAPLWLHTLRGANADITAAPLPAGELLIVGSASGGLTAVDRGTHQRRWHFQAGGAIVGAPVAAGGVLYFGANDRRAYALDLATGAFRWAFATRDAISASPAVGDELVYVASEDRALYALDASSGAERWRFTAGDAIVSTPQLADGALFVGADDGVLYALDAASGDPRWAFTTGGALTSSPVARDGVVFVGSHDGALYALRAASEGKEGDLLWSYDAEGAIIADLALGDDTVYLVTADGRVRAVDAASGAERWRAGDGQSFDGAPLLAGDRLVVGRERQLLFFEARTGRPLAPVALGSSFASRGVTADISGDGAELFVGRSNGLLQVVGAAERLPWQAVWQADALSGELRSLADRFETAPAVAGDRLAVVTFYGRVFSVDLDDGSPRALGRLSEERIFPVAPAADAETVYAVDGAGTLYALDLGQGAERWRFDLGGRTRGSPAATDGRVLAAASGAEGTVAYGLGAADGAELWRRALPPAPLGAPYTAHGDGRLYVAAGTAHALDGASGEVLWSADEGLIVLQLAAAGDAVYGFGSDGERWLLAGWDAATGEQTLLAPIASDSFPSLTGALGAGEGAVAALMADGTLLLLDAATGEERWRLRLEGAPRGAPLIHGGAALVQTLDNHLLAYDLGDGRLRGDFALLDDSGFSDSSAVSPTLHEGRIYVAFYQGLAALELRGAARP